MYDALLFHPTALKRTKTSIKPTYTAVSYVFSYLSLTVPHIDTSTAGDKW